MNNKSCIFDASVEHRHQIYFRSVKSINTMKCAAESAVKEPSGKSYPEVRSGSSEEETASTRHEDLRAVSEGEEGGKECCRKEHVESSGEMTWDMLTGGQMEAGGQNIGKVAGATGCFCKFWIEF